jgi:DNA-binding response OmpR family regulator
MEMQEKFTAEMHEPLRVGHLVIDVARRSVVLAGKEVALSEKEFSLLAQLASDPTRIFSRDELLRGASGSCDPGPARALDASASCLRRKLDPEHGRYVFNCWGVGYRLCKSRTALAAGAEESE